MGDLRSEDRLVALLALKELLADQLESPDGSHSMAQLARQYRETLREISELEDDVGDDEIASIIGVGGNGKTGAD